MLTLTENETKVLKSLANNNYGEQGDGVWSNAVNDSLTPSGITGSSLAGVIGSLCKKGVITSQEYDRNEEVIWMTETGKELVKTLGLVEA